MRQITAKTKTNLPERITEWTAPTGRKLVPGTEMKVKGWPGKWIFLAYVDHPTFPHVEARKVSTRASARGTGNVRCFDPASIFEVSSKKSGGDGS